MTGHGEKRESEAAREVLAYFLRHPDAADDVIGIAQWRLLDTRVRTSVSESAAALARLVEQGFLVAERRASRTIFRLNPERATEAAEHLRRHPTR